MVAARGEDTARQTCDEFKAAGFEAAYCLVDVSDWDQVQQMVATTVSTFGTVDILCANAGIFPQVMRSASKAGPPSLSSAPILTECPL